MSIRPGEASQYIDKLERERDALLYIVKMLDRDGGIRIDAALSLAPYVLDSIRHGWLKNRSRWEYDKQEKKDDKGKDG